MKKVFRFLTFSLILNFIIINSNFAQNCTPTVKSDPITDLLVIHDSIIEKMIITGKYKGVNYLWENSNTAIGLAKDGIDSIPSFTATNNGTSAISATISITPNTMGKIQYRVYSTHGGDGSYNANYPREVNLSSDFDKLVDTSNPLTQLHELGYAAPSVLFNWTSKNSLLNKNISLPNDGNYFCLEIISTFIPKETGTYSFSLNSDDAGEIFIDTTIVTSFYGLHPLYSIPKTGEIDLIAGQEYTLKIRYNDFWQGEGLKVAWKRPSQSNYSIQADELRSCTGEPTSFNITVNPKLQVNQVSDKDFCNNEQAQVIPFTSPSQGAIEYNWTNSNPAIGLAASGSGNIPAFTATNSGSTPISATILVTPSLGQGSIVGQPMTFTITVKPGTTLNPVSNQVLCNNSSSTAVNFNNGNAGSITYSWTNSNPAIGLAASGTGNIPSFTATNTGNADISGTIRITANFQGGTGCAGNPITFTYTIKPQPDAITTPASQTICSGAALTAINISGKLAGTTFNWIRDNSSTITGIGNNGTGNITGTLTNTSATAQTVTFTITPSSAGCTGTPATATVLVQAPLSITCPSNISIDAATGSCAKVVTYTVNTSGTPAPALSYTFSGATTGSGSGDGSGTSFNVGVTTITLTATNSCSTTTCSFTVTVNDVRIPTISTQPTNRRICEGENASFSVSASNASSYQWQIQSGNTFNNISGTNTSTYTLNNGILSLNGNTYRVQITGPCNTVTTSNNVVLTVNPNPTVNISSNAVPNILPGQVLILTANPSIAGGTYQWTLNGTNVNGGNVNKLSSVTVDQAGNYRVNYVDPNGCKASSADFAVNALYSARFWVYPNPSNGQFSIRFFNKPGERVTGRVYDIFGRLVHQQTITTSYTYSQMNFNISTGALAQSQFILIITNEKGEMLDQKRLMMYR